MCVRPCVGEKEELALSVIDFFNLKLFMRLFNHVRVGVFIRILEDGWIEREKIRRKDV